VLLGPGLTPLRSHPSAEVIHPKASDPFADAAIGEVAITGADRKPSFVGFLQGIDEVVAALRFQDDALLATVEIARSAAAKKP